MKYHICAGLVFALFGATSFNNEALAVTPVRAQTTLKATAGNLASGNFSFLQTPEGVEVSGTIRGLSPNSRHGFHVHENGDCSAPDAKSAGGHFDPTHYPHGNPSKPPHHAGDMPNIESNESGIAQVDVLVNGVTLGGGPTSLLGKSVVVHEDSDDYTSQPSGGSGSRIACGVISASQQPNR